MTTTAILCDLLIDNIYMKSPTFGLRRWSTRFLVLVAIGILLFVFEVFPNAGSYLVVQAAEPAYGDIVVVLGGGWNERITTGKELLERGYVNRVLLTGVSPQREGSRAPLDPRYASLLAAGISADMIYLDNSAQNTWQEAVLIRSLVQSRGWHKVLIVTDPPHLRRLTWVCNRVLSRVGIDYYLIPTHPLWWDKAHWWRNETSSWFVAREYLKLLGYLLLYS